MGLYVRIQTSIFISLVRLYCITLNVMALEVDFCYGSLQLLLYGPTNHTYRAKEVKIKIFVYNYVGIKLQILSSYSLKYKLE